MTDDDFCAKQTEKIQSPLDSRNFEMNFQQSNFQLSFPLFLSISDQKAAKKASTIP